MTVQEISSLMSYTDSKITPIMLAYQAGDIREAIKAGRIEGVSFPVKKVKLRMRKAPPRDTEGQIRKINAINALRRDGMNATLAADAVGVAYSTYRTWSNDHKIECNTNSRWDNR